MKSFDVFVLKGSVRNLPVERNLVSKHNSFVGFPSTDGRGACWKRGGRPAPSGLSRRRQRRSGAWPERQMSVSHCCGFFFLQPLLVPTKAQQRLKCLCLSPDKRRQAGRNTSMSVLSRLSWLSPLPTLCRSRAAAGQGWQIHWNKQTNCKFGFSSQIYFQVSLISWVSSQDKRPIHMINIPVTDTDDVCCL